MNKSAFRQRYENWKNGLKVYDAGKVIEKPNGPEEKQHEDAALRAALEYALAVKLDKFDSGKDAVAGSYNFNAIKLVSDEAPLSYGSYYDLTGDVVFDGRLHKYDDGKNPDDKLADMIIGFEGFLPTPKDIGDGRLTIGSGLTADKYVKMGKISKEQNRLAVLNEIAERRARLSDTVFEYDALPRSSQDALVSYDFNFPITEKSSPKFLEAMRNRDYIAAQKELNAGINMKGFSKGLAKRRKKEQELFLRDLIQASPLIENTKESLMAEIKNDAAKLGIRDATRVTPFAQERQFIPEQLPYVGRYWQGERNLNLPLRGEVYQLAKKYANYWNNYKPILFLPTR